MLDFRADLHCHSTYSDGTATPQEIIEMACQKGLQGLCMTDHDTIAAYQEAGPYAEAKGLSLISGVEFSAVHKGASVHILAYSFPLQSPLIIDFCHQHHQRRLVRNQAILDRLSAHNMPLTLEEVHPQALNSQASMGRPHIALAMLKKSYVTTIQQAFHDYIGEGKSCYEPGYTFSVEETLDLIHRAKGLAVIAHPHLIDNTALLRDLLTMPFDGIEGYYARFAKSEQERWVKIGQHRGWLVTGGSDFHGAIKPSLPLGCSWTAEETFKRMLAHFKQHSMH